MSDFENLTIIDRLNITLDNLNMTHLIGKIKIYAGTTLPAGYVWCDGNNDTPNLTDKFIISDLSGGTQQTIGNNQFASNMISHTHNVNTTIDNTNYDCNSKIFANNAQTNAVVNADVSLSSFINTLESPFFQTQILDQVGNPDDTTGTDIKKSSKNHKNVISSVYHTHNVGTVSALAFEIDVNLNYNISADITNDAKNISLGNEGDDVDYEPPYAYIGFIMKDPSTWL